MHVGKQLEILRMVDLYEGLMRWFEAIVGGFIRIDDVVSDDKQSHEKLEEKCRAHVPFFFLAREKLPSLSIEFRGKQVMLIADN